MKSSLLWLWILALTGVFLLPAPSAQAQNIFNEIRSRLKNRPLILPKKKGPSIKVVGPPIITATHPLDPMSAEEIAAVKPLIKASPLTTTALITDFWVVDLLLEEPAKEEVLSFAGGNTFSRKARCCVALFGKKKFYECLVNLRSGDVEVFQEILDGGPSLSDQDYVFYDECAQIAFDDPRTQKALADRGFNVAEAESWEDLNLDPSGDALGWSRDEKLKKKSRYLRFTPQRENGNPEYYMKPFVEGLMITVDLYNKTIVAFENLPGTSIEPPAAQFNFLLPETRGAPRTGLVPADYAQAGVSYTLSGNVVEWQNWRFRYSVTPREGLVLHQVEYKDGATYRSICYRASISELFVPYLAGSGYHQTINYFDASDYNLGSATDPVMPGINAPATAVALSYILPYDDAAENTEVNAVAYENCLRIYERPGDQLIMDDLEDGHFGSRRQDLVIGFIVSLGNYSYICNWIFKQDGSFGFEADAHGVCYYKTVASTECPVCMTPAAAVPGKLYSSKLDDINGTLVAPGVVAVTHQHIFNLRMDFDIDGLQNAAKECNNVTQSRSSKNPSGKSSVVTHYIFAKEKLARRLSKPEDNRAWVMYNPTSRSAFGHPRGYAVEVMPGFKPGVPKSDLTGIEGMAAYNFWVTRYKPAELLASGYYPVQSSKDYKPCLIHYSDDNQSVFKEDIVCWFSLGFTHVPRPEEFPIMTGTKKELMFVPKGFFDKNPGLDTTSFTPYPTTEGTE